MLQAELPVLPSIPVPAGVALPEMQGTEMAENGDFTVLLALELAAFAPMALDVAGEAGTALPIVEGKPGGKDLPVALPLVAGSEGGEGKEAAGGEAEKPLNTVPPVPPAAFLPVPVTQNEPDGVLETAAPARQPLPPRTDMAPTGPMQPARIAATARPEMPTVRFADAPPAAAAERPVPGAVRPLTPPVAMDVFAPSPGASADLAMQAPAATSQPQAAAYSPLPASMPMPRDIATLIDRLVEARDTAASQASGATVGATLAHAQFGRVALQLRPDDSGLTVSMTSADPGFAPAAQAAVAASAQSAVADDGRGSQPRPDHQQPGSHSSGSQAQQSGPRRAAPEREGPPSDEAGPRRENGIYA